MRLSAVAYSLGIVWGGGGGGGSVQGIPWGWYVGSCHSGLPQYSEYSEGGAVWFCLVVYYCQIMGYTCTE